MVSAPNQVAKIENVAKREPEAAAREQIIGLAGDAARHEHADRELDDQVGADADQNGLHGTMARFSVC